MSTITASTQAAGPSGPQRRRPKQQTQQHGQSTVISPRPAYVVAKVKHRANIRQNDSTQQPETADLVIQPVQQMQLLDDPNQWPDPPVHPSSDLADHINDDLLHTTALPSQTQPVWILHSQATAAAPSHSKHAQCVRLPWARPARKGPPAVPTRAAQLGAPRKAGHAAHKRPPVAPEDPYELLQVLQAMDDPRRRLVIFKGGGYIYSDMEALIEAAGLSHVMRLTNLVRKAHCIVAKQRRDTGKHVNLSEHQAAARNANIPFLLIDRLEPEALVALVRPVLIRKGIVVERLERRARQPPVAQDPE